MKLMIDFAEKFVELTAEEEKLIVDSNHVKNFKKGHVIKSSSTVATEGYFVLSGCLYSSYINNDELVVVDFFFEGDPVILPEPSSVYELRCLENSSLAISRLDQNENLVSKMPKFERICRLYAEEKLNHYHTFHRKVLTLEPVERYKLLFLTKRKILERVPQKLIASYLNLTPETLSRVRNKITTQSIDLYQ